MDSSQGGLGRAPSTLGVVLKPKRCERVELPEGFRSVLAVCLPCACRVLAVCLPCGRTAAGSSRLKLLSTELCKLRHSAGGVHSDRDWESACPVAQNFKKPRRRLELMWPQRVTGGASRPIAESWKRPSDCQLGWCGWETSAVKAGASTTDVAKSCSVSK